MRPKERWPTPVSRALSAPALNLFKQAADIDFQLIPHNGAAPATAAVLGGHIETAMLAINLESQAASGKLVRLATASPKRLPDAPDWPTVAESGVPGF